MIQQAHAERFSVVLGKILSEKIPVTFLLAEPITQAVEIVKNFRAQGLDITTLIVTDSTPPPSQP